MKIMYLVKWLPPGNGEKATELHPVDITLPSGSERFGITSVDIYLYIRMDIADKYNSKSRFKEGKNVGYLKTEWVKILEVFYLGETPAK